MGCTVRAKGAGEQLERRDVRAEQSEVRAARSAAPASLSFLDFSMTARREISLRERPCKRFGLRVLFNVYCAV